MSSPAALAFSFALLVRLPLLFLAPSDERNYFYTPDSRTYAAIAQNLVTRGCFSADSAEPLRPNHSRTPGYPVLLAALSLPEGKVRARLTAAVQALLGAAIAGLTARVALRCGAGAGGAVLAGAIAGIDLASIFFNFTILTETLFTFLALAGTLALLSAVGSGGRSTWFAAGVLLSLSALTRPIAIYLPAPIGILLLFYGPGPGIGRRLRGIACFLAGFAVLPSLWMARNINTGSRHYASIQWRHLVDRAGAVEGIRKGDNWGSQAGLLAGQLRSAPGDEVGLAREAQALAVRIIVENPGVYLFHLAIDSGRLLGYHGLEVAEHVWLWQPDRGPQQTVIQPPNVVRGLGTRRLLREHPVLWPGLLLYLPFLGLTYLACAYGVREAWSRRRPEPLLITVILAYLFLISVGGMAGARFRVPMLPFIAVLAGLGAGQTFYRRAYGSAKWSSPHG